jgi:hypothetical protein
MGVTTRRRRLKCSLARVVLAPCRRVHRDVGGGEELLVLLCAVDSEAVCHLDASGRLLRPAQQRDLHVAVADRHVPRVPSPRHQVRKRAPSFVSVRPRWSRAYAILRGARHLHPVPSRQSRKARGFDSGGSLARIVRHWPRVAPVACNFASGALPQRVSSVALRVPDRQTMRDSPPACRCSATDRPASARAIQIQPTPPF